MATERHGKRPHRDVPAGRGGQHGHGVFAIPAAASSEILDDLWVVHVCGEVDLASATILRRALAAAGAQERSVIVDLTRTRYMDGTGITALEDAADAARRQRRAIGIVASRGLRAIFEIVSLTSRARVFATLPDAVASLRQAADSP